MPLPPPPVLITDIVIKTPHGRRRNRLYYVPDGLAPDIDTMQDICDGFFDFWKGRFTPLMSSECQFEKVEGRFWDGTNDFQDISTEAPVDGDIEVLAGEGLGDGDSMPDEASLICQRYTGKGGRSKRGRIFVTGLAEAVNDSGEISEDFRQEAKDLANALPSDVPVTGAGAEGSVNFLFHARHWDRKNSVLEPIVRGYALSTVGTRRDRRRPLKLERIP